MIRDNLKIYAEKNFPDTVKTDTILLENKFVIDNGQRQIMSFAPIKALIITNDNAQKSQIDVLPGSIGMNKYLVTDNNGELTWR